MEQKKNEDLKSQDVAEETNDDQEGSQEKQQEYENTSPVLSLFFYRDIL